MEVDQILCMNGGEGETSYANNSLIQKEAMLKAKPILEESIAKVYLSSSAECLNVADFGCSSGPNTLLLIWEMIDTIHATSQGFNRKAPMFQVFLNDLPGNDFNTIFRSLPSFYEKLKKDKGSEFGPCFIAGMPGNFYGRLFPNHFLHFVHSSYCLHWRSQIPDLVGESGVPLNKGNIHIAKTSPHGVRKAYLDLFKRDFTSFLRSRAQEMVPGGHMVLTFQGMGSNRKADSSSNQSFTIWELLGITLNDMVLEGKVEEAKLDRFNLPFYAPTAEEVRDVIQTEGSFNIQRLETVEVDWDSNMDDSNKSFGSDKPSRGKYVAIGIRVVAEPILASYFGEDIMDDLFDMFSNNIEEYLEVEEAKYTNIIVSMNK
ncbi:probable jasmonic acid carboxyl methyltransferase 2 [Corylus avellana]|uniref:probable jasmonic acid carboxyl methyltransferase 2 n=1 Tax=Corylus avellana TaxID=13451 RepID=UPI00286ADDC1|nr:probable jasmonic acid carboxyl methyltransferase 2 [Corylus avellana]